MNGDRLTTCEQELLGCRASHELCFDVSIGATAWKLCH